MCYLDIVERLGNKLFLKNHLYQVVPTPNPDLTTVHGKTLTNGGKPPCKQQTPCNSGVFYWKGSAMKKYIPIDFDEKGKVILGRERNTPTSNKFIPTTWVPGGGGDEGKNGLKSISISPAITTTPALDSLFPIYWDDLTDEEKVSGRDITLTAPYDEYTDYYITVTPTDDWYAFDPDTHEPGGEGEPVTYLLITGGSNGCVVASSTDSPPEKYVVLNLTIEQGGQ